MALAAAILLALACTKEVEVPVERIVEKTVEVEKRVEVPVEKIVEVPVEKIVEVVVTPTPETVVASAGPKIYKMGIFKEPLTRNYWNYFGGPGASVWTAYVLDPVATALYGYSDQRFDWIPIAADGLPTPLVEENVGGTPFWTTEVRLREGLTWSDGLAIDAGDFEFTVNTVLRLQLGGNFSQSVDPEFVDHVEATGPYAAKVYFKAADAEGNPQTPGLATWQFGLATVPILPKHYWERIVEQAVASSSDITDQQAALFSHVPNNEPTAGGFIFNKWERGAFIEYEKDPNWFNSGTKVIEYENGAYREVNEALGLDRTLYGEATGPTSLEFEIGPHADSELFSIYGNQDSSVLALTKGDVDYVFNPIGLEKGFLDRLEASPEVEVISNPSNGFRYLGFNVRKPPMNIKEFRQAVATVIDKEFVANSLLQGSAIPVYSVVPEGNGFWYNPEITKIGKGLTRAERITQAVTLLKQAGFTYDEEPRVSDDGNFVEEPGKGLKMPDGTPVPQLEIMGSSAGYDPLRATFNIWIERWLNDVGIPAKAKLTSVNVIVGVIFSDAVATDLDMWIMGWDLVLYPKHLEQFFNSRNMWENAPGGFNWGGFASADYDQLSRRFLTETEVGDARSTAFELQLMLADELPYVPLFTTPILDTYRPGSIEFPYADALGGIQFKLGLQQEVLIK